MLLRSIRHGRAVGLVVSTAVTLVTPLLGIAVLLLLGAVAWFCSSLVLLQLRVAVAWLLSLCVALLLGVAVAIANSITAS